MNQLIRISVVAIVLARGAAAAHAQTFTWNSGTTTTPTDGTGTWSTSGTRWYDGTSNIVWPAAPTSTVAWFGNGGTAGTVTVSGSVNAGGITFGPSGTSRYTLTGGTIGLADSATIFLSGSYTPPVNSATGIAGASIINSRLVANNLAVSRRDGETGITALTLGGSNSLTGTLTVTSSAALKVNAVNALDGDAEIVVNAGGAVEISATGTFNNNFTLSDNGFGALRFNRPVTLSGTITMASDVTIGPNPLYNMDGVTGPVIIQNGIAETDGLAKNLTINGNYTNANGVLLLRGASTYSGSTTIFGSTAKVQLEGGDNRLPAGTFLTMRSILTLGGTTFGAMSQEVSGLNGAANEAVIRGGASGTSTLVVNSAGASSFNQRLGGVGTFDNNFGITKKGAGTLTLGYDAGRLATYSGPTMVLEGTLTAGKVSNNSPIIVAAGATYNFAHTNGSFGGPITTTISGSGAVNVTSGTLTLASNSTFAGNFSNSSTTFLTGSNTFTGTTALAGGNLEVGNQFALGGGGDIRFGGGTLRFSGSGTPDVAAQVKNSASAMLFDTNGQSVTFTNSLEASNTGGLTKSGSGTLTLTGNNAYSGATTVSGGVLRFADSAATISSGTVSIANTAGATLDINGATQSIAALTGGGALGGSVILSGGTLAVGSANTSTTYSGNFTGTPGMLAKQGRGILTLNGTSSTLSGISLQGGQLVVSPTSTSTFALGTIARSVGTGLSLQPGTGTVTVDSVTPVGSGMIGPWAITGTGANLTYATHSAGLIVGYTPSGTASTAASLPNSAAANFILQSATGTIPSTVVANTIRYTGATAQTTLQTNGSFTVNSLMNAGSGAWTLGTTGTLTMGSSELVLATNNQSFTLNGVAIRETVAGSNLTLISQGGNFTLSGAVGYTGDVNYSSTSTAPQLSMTSTGTLNNINLPTGAPTSFTFSTTGVFQVNGGVAGLGATLTKNGAGVLRILGTSAYTGATTISVGSIEVASLANVGAASSLGTPTATTGTIGIANGATLRYIGAASSTTDRVLNLSTAGSGTVSLDASGAGPLTFTSALSTSGTGSKTFTLTGTSTAANTFAGTISDVNVGLNQLTSVTKTGPGRWVLSGASSYTGAFTLDNGTLVAAANAGDGDGVFGNTGQVTNPTIGSTSVTTGTAALLLASGVSVNRNLSVAAPSGSQAVVLGGADTFGTAEFGTGANIEVGRPVILSAASSGTNRGTVRFANSWAGVGGSGNPTPSFTIGTAGNEGIVRLASDLQTSGSVAVRYGTLNVELDRTVTPGTGPLSIDSGASLAGVGSIAAALTGGGRIGPGNSPGILTAESITPSSLIFDFEFTNVGAPNYADASASINDILRLTGTSPFASALTSSNIVNVYFDLASVGDGDTFLGGFFTDQQADFLSSISGATYNYFIRDAGGGTIYNDQTYAPFTSSVTVSTVASGAADFAGGAVNGQITQFSIIVVPEPGGIALLASAAVAGWAAFRRRRR